MNDSKLLSEVAFQERYRRWLLDVPVRSAEWTFREPGHRPGTTERRDRNRLPGPNGYVE